MCNSLGWTARELSQTALACAREFKIPVQVNRTVTTGTMPHLPAVFDLLKDRHAPPVRRWSLFLLVPVGRGTELGVPTAEQIEQLFGWVNAVSEDAPFHVGTVEAPHYRRYWIQQKEAAGMPPAAIAQMARCMGFGVRDGNGVIFVSHRGDVDPAGFLPHPLLGNVRERPLSEIYRTAPALLRLRDMNQLMGACGACDYRWACGGSRARAYAMTGNMMATDPFCLVPVGATAAA